MIYGQPTFAVIDEDRVLARLYDDGGIEIAQELYIDADPTEMEARLREKFATFETVIGHRPADLYRWPR